MGDWAIVVHGTGAHHNKDFPKDADRMTQKFVDDLIGAGHEVRLATFTSGGRTVLDVTENFAARFPARTSEETSSIEQALTDRRTAFARLGLTASPRKDPLPGGPPA